MRQDRGVEYRCDECRKNVTGRRHVRILLGFTSGWMLPPFHAGLPAISVCDRNPEYHFCAPECMTLFFNRKLYEIRPDTTRDVRGNDGASAVGKVLAKAGIERPRVPGQADVGARDTARRQEGKRDVGDREAVRVVARGGSVPGRGGHGEEHQQVDSFEQDRGLGGGGEEVPAHELAPRPTLSDWLVWPFAAARRGVRSVLP